MSTNEIVVLGLAGMVVLGAWFLFSEPRTKVVAPRHENISSLLGAAAIIYGIGG